MQINIDRFETLYLLEGCARGSHLRQGIWQRAVDEFYGKLTNGERIAVYMYAKRDITEIFAPKRIGGNDYQHVGHEDFFHFLARFNPANQYVLHMKGDVDGVHHDELVRAYKYDGEYHVKFNRICAKEYIVEVKRSTGFDKCSLPCMWHEHCKRYDAKADENKSLYINSKCDWFINKDTEHGADLKHFRV